MDYVFSFRRFGYAAAAMAAVLTIGTIGFRWSLDEGWLQSSTGPWSRAR